jgi:hypothetical protein
MVPRPQSDPGDTRSTSKSEEDSLEQDRLREVEKSLQDTRERMIHGFGDIRLAISKQGNEITEKIGATEKELGNQINAVDRSTRNRTLTIIAITIASVGIATVILANVL